MAEQALAVLLVLALLGGALWFLKNRGLAQYRGPARRKSARHLEAIARLPLAPQHSVHLIRVLDHAIVLTVSPSGCRVVESVPWNTTPVTETAETSIGAAL